MKVTLRKKGISKGMVSLYLDFYPAILNPDTGAFMEILMNLTTMFRNKLTIYSGRN